MMNHERIKAFAGSFKTGRERYAYCGKCGVIIEIGPCDLWPVDGCPKDEKQAHDYQLKATGKPCGYPVVDITPLVREGVRYFRALERIGHEVIDQPEIGGPRGAPYIKIAREVLRGGVVDHRLQNIEEGAHKYRPSALGPRR